MTFSLHQGGVVMSSQIKHTHSHQDTPLSPNFHNCRQHLTENIRCALNIDRWQKKKYYE